MSSDLVSWLRDRLDEEEQTAGAAAPGPWSYGDNESVAGGTIYDPTVAIASIEWDNDPEAITANGIRRGRPKQEADATGRHIARHDPIRVLAEVAAKRAMLDRVAVDGAMAWEPLKAQGATTQEWWLISTCRDVLKLLAQPYRDHPDYRREWDLP